MPTGRSRSCFAFFAIPFFTINKKTTKQNKTKFWKIFSTKEHWCEKENAGDNSEDSKSRDTQFV